MTKKKLLVITGGLFVAGTAIAGILYVAFPVAMTTYGGMGQNAAVGEWPRYNRTATSQRYSPLNQINTIGAITPTAGGVVFFGDLGGNLYALDSSNGQKLWGQVLDGGGRIGGGIITYTVDGAQKIAVADGFTMVAWPTKPTTAKVIILGLGSASDGQ